jgi:hypothetical protein
MSSMHQRCPGDTLVELYCRARLNGERGRRIIFQRNADGAHRASNNSLREAAARQNEQSHCEEIEKVFHGVLHPNQENLYTGEHPHFSGKAQQDPKELPLR